MEGTVGKSNKVGVELWSECAWLAEAMRALRLVGSGGCRVEERSWRIMRSER